MKRDKPIMAGERFREVARVLYEKMRRLNMIDFTYYEASVRLENDIRETLMQYGIYSEKLLLKIYEAFSSQCRELDFTDIGVAEWVEDTIKRVLMDSFEIVNFDEIKPGEPGISY